MASARKIGVLALALALAAVYLYAGVLKLVRPDALLADILSYRLVPYRMAYLAAFLLPAVEIVAALALLFPATRREAAWTLAGLTTVFTLALASAWARGLDISCGCFGASDTTANYPWLVGRDLLILAACLVLCAASPGTIRPPVASAPVPPRSIRREGG